MFPPKLLCAVALVYLASTPVNAGISKSTNDKMWAGFKPIVEICAKDLGVTEDQLQQTKKTGNADKINPCFFDCILKKGEVFNDDSMLNSDKTAAIVKVHVLDDAEAAAFIAAVDSCKDASAKGANGCERGNLMFNCVMQHLD